MIQILDTTIREGSQAFGVYLSEEDKKRIALTIDQIGIDFIEIGHPSISDESFRTCCEINNLNLNAETVGHARANKKDILSVYKSGCKWVGIFCGLNELYLKYKLNNRRLNDVLDIVCDSILFAKSLGLKVRYTPEDTSRTELSILLDAFEKAKKCGVDRLSIADTVGIYTPEQVAQLVSTLKKKISLPMSIHCHNDRGLALANALSAYKHGVKVIDASVNGLGERAGITSLQELLVVLAKNYQIQKYNLGLITHLTREVSLITGFRPDSLRPIVGKNVFKHSAAIHQLAVKKNPICYSSLEYKEISNF